MKLINPSKLIEELNKGLLKTECNVYGERLHKYNSYDEIYEGLFNEVIKAIEVSIIDYPYINDTVANIHNQNGW